MGGERDSTKQRQGKDKGKSYGSLNRAMDTAQGGWDPTPESAVHLGSSCPSWLFSVTYVYKLMYLFLQKVINII